MKIPALLHKRISLDAQGYLGQGGEHPEHEQSPKEKQSSQLRQSQTPLISHRGGHYHDKNIQIVSQKHHDPRHNHEPVDPFVFGVHQHQQGEHKGHYNHGGEGHLVVADPRHEIGDLLGDVRIPDQHELGEPQIGPTNSEPKHELGQIMDMAVVHMLQMAPGLQIDSHHG